MKKNKQARIRFISPAMGELAIFLLAWTLGIIAALNGDNTHSGSGDDIAASGSYSIMTDILD